MRLFLGDCLEVMPTLEADSVDAIITDPPYGLSFMGKHWDRGVPGVDFWIETLRVAKPGCHMLAFGGTRTFHRLTCAIEDAGWEIRDCVMWVYGSGFPKSLDVSKAIDKAAGAERKVVGLKTDPRYMSPRNRGFAADSNGNTLSGHGPDSPAAQITAAATNAAKEWQGWGTALKPAWEPIILARKPIEGTVAANVQRYGTGAMNIDGSRIATSGPLSMIRPARNPLTNRDAPQTNRHDEPFQYFNDKGRFPANLIHDGSEEVMESFPDVNGPWGGNGTKSQCGATSIFGIGDNPNNERYKGTGSASRFFYCAKASKADRDEGCDGLPMSARPTSGDGIGGQPDQHRENNRNNHPTVKPTALMRYLCRLITPPGGMILDPFMGSGSTGKAAILEGFDFIGIEIEPEYLKIAEARIGAATKQERMQYA